ncbi:MAG: hypothetical protein ACON38_02840 [Akkermansiaceae bacterium]
MPEDLINGIIGVVEKNISTSPSSTRDVIITPAAGTSIVTGMELWVANDAAERDPASYELWGTNTDISGGGLRYCHKLHRDFYRGLGAPRYSGRRG